MADSPDTPQSTDSRAETNADALKELSFDASSDGGRTAGFCLECRRLVERQEGGTCPEGHVAEGVVGMVALPEDFEKELPQVTSFNWGAFFIPMVWGPVYGMWAGILLFPLWMFVDNVVYVALTRGGAWWAGAAAVIALTVLIMVWFARTATIPAYLKLKTPTSIEKFNRQQKTWGIIGAIFFVVILALASAYNIVYRIPGVTP